MCVCQLVILGQPRDRRAACSAFAPSDTAAPLSGGVSHRPASCLPLHPRSAFSRCVVGAYGHMRMHVGKGGAPTSPPGCSSPQPPHHLAGSSCACALPPHVGPGYPRLPAPQPGAPAHRAVAGVGRDTATGGGPAARILMRPFVRDESSTRQARQYATHFIVRHCMCTQRPLRPRSLLAHTSQQLLAYTHGTLTHCSTCDQNGGPHHQSPSAPGPTRPNQPTRASPDKKGGPNSNAPGLP